MRGVNTLRIGFARLCLPVLLLLGHATAASAQAVPLESQPVSIDDQAHAAVSVW